MKKAIIYIFLLLPVYILLNCKRSPETSTVSQNFPYNLNSADREFTLPASLKEISGMSYLSSNKLACIQDEQGMLFIFDPEQSKIVEEINFGKKGDYEGIEVIKDDAYVIKSNGVISKFGIGKEGESSEITTPLKTRNDVEGLGYNTANNRLLIACKAKGDVNANNVEGKAIYEYDLNTQTFIEDPLIVLSQSQIEDGKINKIKFSGIAVNPKTLEIYVLSSSHKLFVFKDKALFTTIPLEPSIFEQPEGICFSPDGTLFISSEGDFGSGKIFKFNLK